MLILSNPKTFIFFFNKYFDRLKPINQAAPVIKICISYVLIYQLFKIKNYIYIKLISIIIMNKINKKFENFIFHKIRNLKNPKILEFGVQKGYSTKRF